MSHELIEDCPTDPGWFSAFVILENGTWEQPVRRFDGLWSERKIERYFRHAYPDAIWVCGVAPDPDVEDCDMQEEDIIGTYDDWLAMMGLTNK